ncbi:hypothetical protein [Roseimicrobium sp. ORNL1]|uniref:hypothetical protein n=1 Tax=Roseimicrobium sp. ORNL1 TaxID=2711231 RepID=UPI0013E17BA4|nr:hypothetical protein [Roseimicrobium sp. ORNL1]QIF02840.1 hypothetical protein G5S37_15360 [Roseimicrobium sp. ORNL1]
MKRKSVLTDTGFMDIIRAPFPSTHDGAALPPPFGFPDVVTPPRLSDVVDLFHRLLAAMKRLLATWKQYTKQALLVLVCGAWLLASFTCFVLTQLSGWISLLVQVFVWLGVCPLIAWLTFWITKGAILLSHTALPKDVQDSK